MFDQVVQENLQLAREKESAEQEMDLDGSHSGTRESQPLLSSVTPHTEQVESQVPAYLMTCSQGLI